MPFSSYAFRGRRNIRRVVVALVGLLSVATTFAAVQLVRTYALVDGASWFLLDGDSSKKPAAGPRHRSSPSSPLVGCARPRLDVLTEDRKSLSTPPPLHCDDDEPNWISASNGTFRIEAATVRRHGDILCQHIPILRDGDDFRVTRGRPTKPMLNDSKLTTDAFETRCVGSNGKVHVGVYSGVAFKPTVAERCRKRPLAGENEVTNVDDEDVLDILIFGFDSVSRLSWMRQLPQTYRYVVERLGAVVVEGYNIVGDGTPQALLPLLTGRTETELPEARRGFPGARTVDEHPWIWRRLMRERGYATQWGEDGASIGTFTYRMLGFQDQPVDHYLRPFYLAVEKRYSKYKPFCLGSVPRHRNMLNWQRDFFHIYGNDSTADFSGCRRFSFVFHSELSHDSNQLLALADLDLREHLAALDAAGHLRRAALVLMSDHGPRFDDDNARSRRMSTSGKYEERLPFLAVRLPSEYARRHPDRVRNLRRNAAADRITTAFDLHETLLDFAAISDRPLQRRRRPETDAVTSSTLPTQRGISLLNEIPADRTCADADVAPHWCTCFQWRSVAVDDVNVRQAALDVIAVINRLTESRRDQCVRLVFDGVQAADMYAVDERLLLFQRSADKDGRVPELLTPLPVAINGTEVLYRVTVKTTPSGALYEATVRMTVEDRKYDVDARQISRVNAYGKQSHCIADMVPHLRAFCYCAEQYHVSTEFIDSAIGYSNSNDTLQ